MAANTQNQLTEFAQAHGWVLDPTETINTYRSPWGYRWADMSDEEKASYIKQDPRAFMKSAAHGGTWKIQFVFTANGRIAGVDVRYLDADGKPGVIGDYTQGSNSALSEGAYARSGEGNWPPNERWVDGAINIGPARLFNETPNSSESWIGSVLHECGTLRKKTEALLSDIEVVLWLAAESKHVTHLRWAAQEAERQRINELRRRPAPEGWTELHEAAMAITRADGLSDRQALIDAVVKAAAGVTVTELQ